MDENERSPLLKHTSYGTNNGYGSNGQELTPSLDLIPDGGVVVTDGPYRPPTQTADLHVYKRRWYILFLFTLYGFLQGGLCNVWTVIAESVEAAFGWTNEDISFLQIWLYGMYLVAMFPCAWLMDTKGLRISCILSTGLVALGAGLRCVSFVNPYVTWLSHAGQIANAMAGPVAFTGGPVVSSLWFPPYQRATATAIGTIAGFLGPGLYFIIGPLMIDAPKLANGTLANTNPILAKPGMLFLSQHRLHDSGSPNANYTNINTIIQELKTLRYIECGVCVAVFVAFLIYFPSKPKKPPSISASLEKLNFASGMKELFSKSKCNFWLIGLSYGISGGIYGLWASLLDVNLKSIGISEKKAGWLGFYSTIGGCVMAVVLGRIVDYLRGQMKVILLVLMAGAIFSQYTFILVGNSYIAFSDGIFYTSCILLGMFIGASNPSYFEVAVETAYPIGEGVASGIITVLFQIFPILYLSINQIPHIAIMTTSIILCGSVLNGFVPLFYELAIEHAYPIAESVTSGMMAATYETFPLIYLLITLFFTQLGTIWMNWCVYGALLLCFPMLLLFKEKYNRSEVDNQGT